MCDPPVSCLSFTVPEVEPVTYLTPYGMYRRYKYAEVMMRVQIKKWGNSASVRIPASIMATAGLDVGQEVDVREDEGRVVIEPMRRTYRLDALLAKMTSDTFHDQIDFGPAVGDELR